MSNFEQLRVELEEKEPQLMKSLYFNYDRARGKVVRNSVTHLNNQQKLITMNKLQVNINSHLGTKA